MSRKFLLALGIVLVVVAGTAGALVLMLRHEPNFYRRSSLPPGAARKQRFIKCQQKFTKMLGDSISNSAWGDTFTEEEINSLLQEEAPRPGSPIRTLLPDKTNDPRVALEPDRVRVGLRYGHGFWSTIISADLRVWLVAKEPNLVALELEQVRAGYLPFGTQTLLEKITEAARGRDIEVTWYRHEGKPVALLRFQPGRQDPTVQLIKLKVQPGMVTINGADRSQPASPEGHACVGETSEKRR